LKGLRNDVKFEEQDAHAPSLCWEVNCAKLQGTGETCSKTLLT